MDSLIIAAGQALAAGDPIGALTRVALRDDPPALALRGIAMAQLGDLARARTLLRRASRAFGAREAMARARCALAEAEVALASRDLRWPASRLDAARATLAAHGDRLNAAHADVLAARRLALVGQLEEASRALAAVTVAALPPAMRAAYALVEAGIAVRHVRARAAASALRRAARAAGEARIPALSGEVERAVALLTAPAARLLSRGAWRAVRLREVEDLAASAALVVDGCRSMVQRRGAHVSLASRPVLFALARTLGEAWPEPAPRDVLVRRAFTAREADESHRARLRVEVGRLRRLLRGLADVRATREGFVLQPRGGREVVVLAPPVDDAHAPVLALLADGEAWSTSALALALGRSQRSVQRALEALAAAGRAQALGRGRTQRWTMPPLPGFATALLLPAPLPLD